MLHENLILLRKQRGMSQEVMAQRLNVVRQTVSKWARGVSVPDGQMLTRIADLFDVSVSDLLGEAKPQDVNEIAVQLALLNEQLANRSRRLRAWCKGGLIALGVILVLWMFVEYGKKVPTQVINPDLVIAIECTLAGENYHYTIDCDSAYRVMSYGGDVWLHENVAQRLTQEPYGELYARDLIEVIKGYVEEQGGTVKIQEVDFDAWPSTGIWQ